MPTPWTKRVSERIAGKEPATPWWVNDKYKLHKFCSDNGLPMPKLYQSWKTPDLIDLTEAPGEFVLKPSGMHSEWGVMVLRRLDDGRFYDSLQNRILTEDVILREQEKVYDKSKYKGSYRVLVEEKIVSSGQGADIPFDYKVYCFYDKPLMVQQFDRNDHRTQAAFFDGDFFPLDLSGRIESNWDHYQLGTPVVPEGAREMLKIAAEVTTKLNTPFMRVDMFASDRGPVIGELTPAPGGAYYGKTYTFTEKYDAELGEEWSAAEARIAAQ